MKHYKTISELHRDSGFPPPEHPLLSLFICDHSASCLFGRTEITTDFYMIGFKKLKSGDILYGRAKYDHDSGSMLFVKPRQVIEMRNIEMEEAAFCIFFHEDYLNGHPLHTEIKKYSFFEYETNESLDLTPKEELVIWDLFHKIEGEYHNNLDEYSRDIILTHLDSILKYSQRYYKRQFINREQLSGKMVSRFNEVLTANFEKGLQEEKGLPTVRRVAAELNMSPDYLSDLLKRETGKTAMELIHIFLISEAKNLLRGPDATIAETAYTLGFENLPYFSRLFKKEVGMSPIQYKKQSLN
ncbi:MAG TPA: helix-turn-helix transcriptional regulator [Puia sp.]|nr:helix-turn-helix transcriptional regulator [Puia sp.]